MKLIMLLSKNKVNLVFRLGWILRKCHFPTLPLISQIGPSTSSRTRARKAEVCMRLDVMRALGPDNTVPGEPLFFKRPFRRRRSNFMLEEKDSKQNDEMR